jgi:fatty acid desaturase
LEENPVLVNYVSHAKIQDMASDNQISKKKSIMHSSHVQHQKQRFWQILFPVLLFGLLLIGVCVLMILTVAGIETGVNLSQFADTALIWIILPMLAAAIMGAIILFFLIYGIARLLKVLPGFTFRVQEIFSDISYHAHVITDKLAAPTIGIKGIFAGVSTLFSKLFRR